MDRCSRSAATTSAVLAACVTGEANTLNDEAGASSSPTPTPKPPPMHCGQSTQPAASGEEVARACCGGCGCGTTGKVPPKAVVTAFATSQPRCDWWRPQCVATCTGFGNHMACAWTASKWTAGTAPMVLCANRYPPQQTQDAISVATPLALPPAAQHSTAQHSTAQHSTAQHSNYQQQKPPKRGGGAARGRTHL